LRSRPIAYCSELNDAKFDEKSSANFTKSYQAIYVTTSECNLSQKTNSRWLTDRLGQPLTRNAVPHPTRVLQFHLSHLQQTYIGLVLASLVWVNDVSNAHLFKQVKYKMIYNRRTSLHDWINIVGTICTKILIVSHTANGIRRNSSNGTV